MHPAQVAQTIRGHYLQTLSREDQGRHALFPPASTVNSAFVFRAIYIVRYSLDGVVAPVGASLFQIESQFVVDSESNIYSCVNASARSWRQWLPRRWPCIRFKFENLNQGAVCCSLANFIWDTSPRVKRSFGSD